MSAQEYKIAITVLQTCLTNANIASMKINRGFTLAEMIITLALVAVLIIITIPTYHNYKSRRYYSKIINVTLPYQRAIEKCYQDQDSLEDCSANLHGIPAAITPKSSDIIETLTVKQGKIIVVPTAKQGITKHDTYILTPEIRRGRLHWVSAGGSVENGYAN